MLLKIIFTSVYVRSNMFVSLVYFLFSCLPSTNCKSQMSKSSIMISDPVFNPFNGFVHARNHNQGQQG